VVRVRCRVHEVVTAEELAKQLAAEKRKVTAEKAKVRVLEERLEESEKKRRVRSESPSEAGEERKRTPVGRTRSFGSSLASCGGPEASCKWRKTATST